MEPVIEVRNLGKRYLLSHKSDKNDRYTALRDVIACGVKDIALKTRAALRGQQILQGDEVEEFWALRSLSFDVEKGEVIGIIGRNGAGKSTLLKVLSRITEPSEGRVKINGRIASLLEVGTGFHPELTGRENIFLNGSILGMKRVEINQKFDQIVQFAGVEKFIDTPVKRYSSGMYVRLAFAVAAHLEPEILIVDEVLAVGDAEFQKRCLGKMKDVAGQGRTILFVSHNMTSLQALCNRAIYLENGVSKSIGSLHEAVSLYIHGTIKQDEPVFEATNLPNDAEAVILRVRVLDSSGLPRLRFKTSEPWFIEILWQNRTGIPVNPNIQLKTITDITALIAMDTPLDWDGRKKAISGTYLSKVSLPAHFLNGNEYNLSVALDSGSPWKYHHGLKDFLKVTLWDPMDETSLARGFFTTPREDAIMWPVLEWKCTGPNGAIH